MLAQDQIELLTAYVDGELSPRQREVALRLVNESSEARRILIELQENAHRIKQLPRHTLDAHFTAEVVEAVATRPMEPVRAARPITFPLRWVPYAAAGVAAAVLFMVGTAGVLYLAFGYNWNGLENDNGIAKNERNDVAPVDPKPAPPVNEGDKSVPPRKTPNPLPGNIMAGVIEQFTAPIPPERSVDLTFAELHDKAQVAERLAAEIENNPALHLDVSVRNNPQAIDRLKNALKAAGVKLVVDPTSEAALKKGGKVEFLVYAENLKADEVTKLLKELAVAGKKTTNPYHKVKVSPLAKQERERVVALLGEDPDKRNEFTDKGIIGPRPKANPKADRVVIVLPQTTDAKRSEELKQFLLQPARPQPGSVRVLVRIHQE